MYNRKKIRWTASIGSIFLLTLMIQAQGLIIPGIQEYKYSASLQEGSSVDWKVSKYKNYNIGHDLHNDSILNLRVIKDVTGINLVDTEKKSYEVFNELFEVRVDGQLVKAENDLSFYPLLVQPTEMLFENGTRVNAIHHIYTQKALTQSSYLVTTLTENETAITIVETYVTLQNATRIRTYEKDTGLLLEYEYQGINSSIMLLQINNNLLNRLGLDPLTFVILSGIIVGGIILGGSIYVYVQKKKRIRGKN